MEIVKTEKYGLANTIDKVIYIHPILDQFPDLKQKIIKHESEHQRAKGFWENRKIDSLTEIKFRDLIPVYKKKPSLLLKQYSPITRVEDTILIEWSLIFTYLFYIGIGIFVYLILKKFSPDPLLTFGYMIGIFLVLGAVYILMKKVMKKINKEASESNATKK